jgi:hypothetical protein
MIKKIKKEKDILDKDGNFIFEGKDIDLFDKEWKKEWKGIPEFIQNDLTSYRDIIVHFSCKDDIDKFEKAIGQRIFPQQKFIWFPLVDILATADKRYI